MGSLATFDKLLAVNIAWYVALYHMSSRLTPASFSLFLCNRTHWCACYKLSLVLIVWTKHQLVAVVFKLFDDRACLGRQFSVENLVNVDCFSFLIGKQLQVRLNVLLSPFYLVSGR